MASTELRLAAQQALEALKLIDDAMPFPVAKLAMKNLRAALAEDAMQKFTDVNQEIEAALAEPVEPTPTFHVEPLKWGCGVCRIGADGKAYGYVCPRLDCPTKVTCGGAV